MKTPKLIQLLIIAFVALLFSSSMVNAATTLDGALASPSLEILKKAASYIEQKDNEALQKLLDTELVFFMKKDVEVEVVEVKLAGYVKIRPRGETYEIWTFYKAVKN